MSRPLSSLTIKEFLDKFGIEPVYVKTPDGYVLELTKMSIFSILDDPNEDKIYPLLIGQYTDLEVEPGDTLGEPYGDLPPS